MKDEKILTRPLSMIFRRASLTFSHLHQGGSIIGEASWRRYHKGGIREEEASVRRYQGGGIIEEAMNPVEKQ